MEAQANPRVVGSLRSFARLAGITVALAGFLVLTGWVLNIPSLKSIYPGLGTMKVNTAFCFLLSGIALRLQCSPRQLIYRHYIIVCAGIVALLGLLTLLDYFFQWRLGIEQLLLRQSHDILEQSTHVRSTPTTAFNLLFVGVALLLIDTEFPRGYWLSQILSIVAKFVSLLVIIGYLYGVNSFYSFGTDLYVSLHAALTCVLLCAGILAARPEHGLMAIVSSNGAGGIMARRLMPAAVVLPLILGGLALFGQSQGWYDTEFRLSLLVGSSILFFAIFIWWGAASLRNIDTERQRAESSLLLYTQRLQNLLEVGRTILEARSQTEIAASTLPGLRRQLTCDLALVTVFDFEQGEATILAVDGEARTNMQLSSHLLLEQTGFGDVEALLRGDLHVVHDIVDNSVPAAPRRAGMRHDMKTLVQWLQGVMARSYVNIPLVSHGEVMGCLTLAWLIPTHPDEESITMAREVADRLAIGMQQARLSEQVHSASEQLKTLSHRLIEAQEAERRHLAHELHDEVGQSLTAVKINLQALQRKPDPGVLRERLEDSIGIVETVLRQVRDLSLDLRPSMLDDLGLVAALRWYVDRQAQRTGLDIRFSADSIEPRLPSNIETACFRITQEALTNVVRHAGATRVEIRLQVVEAIDPVGMQELQLVIRDNGSGFDVGAAHQRASSGSSLGLLGMEERVLLVGGKIEIESSPTLEGLSAAFDPDNTVNLDQKWSSGTEIHACFPLPPAHNIQENGHRNSPHDLLHNNLLNEVS